MPDLAAFNKRWPQVDLQIHVGDELADLAKRQADVAVRVMRHGSPPDHDLAGRLAATFYTATYGFGDCWIGWEGGEADAWWVAESIFPELPVRGAIRDAAVQLHACREGMGLSILPCSVADPFLERRSPPEPAYDIWVLVHPDLRRSPRLRVFRDEMVEALRRHQPRLAGSPERDRGQPQSSS